MCPGLGKGGTAFPHDCLAVTSMTGRAGLQPALSGDTHCQQETTYFPSPQGRGEPTQRSQAADIGQECGLTSGRCREGLSQGQGWRMKGGGWGRLPTDSHGAKPATSLWAQCFRG